MNYCCHGPWHLVPHRGPLPEGVHKSHIVQHFLSSLTFIQFSFIKVFEVRCENNIDKELCEAPGQPPPGKPVTLTHCRKGSKAKEESQNPDWWSWEGTSGSTCFPPGPAPHPGGFGDPPASGQGLCAVLLAKYLCEIRTCRTRG